MHTHTNSKKILPLSPLMPEVPPSKVPVKLKNYGNITLGKGVTLSYHYS